MSSASSPGLAARLVAGTISFYQKMVSPTLGKNCRFSPTCSSYAREAIERFGVRQGGWMALRRIGKCHPLGGEGYDPVSSIGKES